MSYIKSPWKLLSHEKNDLIYFPWENPGRLNPGSGFFMAYEIILIESCLVESPAYLEVQDTGCNWLYVGL